MLEQFIPSHNQEKNTIVRPVSQINVELESMPDKDIFRFIVNEVLQWMGSKAGNRLPDEAWTLKSFDLSEIGSQRVEAVSLSEPRYWAARMIDDDTIVPKRDWITEVGVGYVAENAKVLFGCRLTCAIRGEDEPYNRTIPKFVKKILIRGGAKLDGMYISNKEQLISTENDVERLVSLIENPIRTADVILVSLPENSENPSETLISANYLAYNLIGTAHVYVITSHASYLLTEIFGKEHSVYRQAVRTFKPGFLKWTDESYRHPLALAEKINSWGDDGPNSFCKWLINQTLAGTVKLHTREEILPSFSAIRQLAATEDHKKLKLSAKNNDELIKLYETEHANLNNLLNKEREEYKLLLDTSELECDSVKQEFEEAKESIFYLRQRVTVLEEQLKNKSEEVIEIPTSLADFEDWNKNYLSGYVEVVPRALRELQKSVFENIQLIYDALLLLRNEYRAMRIEGNDVSRLAYQKALENLHLEESQTGEATKFNISQYQITHNGQNKILDRHLKFGNTHDPRYCFRLYFFWKGETQTVVVGWLPSHLDTKAT